WRSSGGEGHIGCAELLALADPSLRRNRCAAFLCRDAQYRLCRTSPEELSRLLAAREISRSDEQPKFVKRDDGDATDRGNYDRRRRRHSAWKRVDSGLWRSVQSFRGPALTGRQ